MNVFRQWGLWLLLFVTTAVSAQTIQIRTAPRVQGNYQFMQPQRAYNTFLLSRLPRNWTLPPNRYLLWQGPVLASPTERAKLFTNGGITHSMIPDATNPMNLPSSKRGNFPGGGGAHNLSGVLAGELGGGDARTQALVEYANPPYYVSDNTAAYQYLGYKSFKSSVGANNGIAPTMWGMDLEDHQDKPGYPGSHLTFVTHMYEGAKQAITELSLDTKLFTYGSAALTRPVEHIFNRQDADIYFRIPGEYWLGDDGFFSVSGAKTAIFRQGAYIGYDKYSRRTWDNATLWQKNTDGSIKTDGSGFPLYHVGKRTIQNYGQTCETYTYEAPLFDDMFYSEADKLLTEWRWRCNTPVSGYSGNFVNMPFPRGTGDIRPGLEKVKVINYFRDNTEIEQQWNPDINNFDPFYTTPELGIEAANSRALNPSNIEFTVLFRTMLTELVYIFGNPGNYADWVNGTANQHVSDFRGTGGQNNYAIKQRFGQFETMLNASRRGRNFPELFKVMDAGKGDFVLPWRFVVRGNTQNLEESQANKPIFWGVKEKAGRRMWAAWCFPSQDVSNSAHDRDLIMWIELPNGQKSPSYTMRCKDRATGFDQFLLPAGFENATAEDFRFKFVGLLGSTFYRTGNYNVSVTGTPSVPAAASSTVTTYVIPTSQQ